jgi:hypothetical protein
MMFPTKGVNIMSPIDQGSIRVEERTITRDGKFNKAGDIVTQVLAKGDKKDPGSYVLESSVLRSNLNRIKGKGLIVDVDVDLKTGEIKNDPDVCGVWRRYRKEG